LAKVAVLYCPTLVSKFCLILERRALAGRPASVAVKIAIVHRDSAGSVAGVAR